MHYLNMNRICPHSFFLSNFQIFVFIYMSLTFWDLFLLLVSNSIWCDGSTIPIQPRTTPFSIHSEPSSTSSICRNNVSKFASIPLELQLTPATNQWPSQFRPCNPWDINPSLPSPQVLDLIKLTTPDSIVVAIIAVKTWKQSPLPPSSCITNWISSSTVCHSSNTH